MRCLCFYVMMCLCVCVFVCVTHKTCHNEFSGEFAIKQVQTYWYGNKQRNCLYQHKFISIYHGRKFKLMFTETWATAVFRAISVSHKCVRVIASMRVWVCVCVCVCFCILNVICTCFANTSRSSLNHNYRQTAERNKHRYEQKQMEIWER